MSMTQSGFRFFEEKNYHPCQKFFFMVRGAETRRIVMLNGGISNTGSAMKTGKGVHKGTNVGGKMFEKGTHGDYCSYCKRSGHTKEICFKLHGRKNVLERMGNNKGCTQRWVNHTTSEQEATNKCSSSQSNPQPPDLDMKAYKEKLERLEAMVESMSKLSGSCTLSIKGKIYLNSVGQVSQGIWILDLGAIDHMTPFSGSFDSYGKSNKAQLIMVANGQGIPICGSGNIIFGLIYYIEGCFTCSSIS
ncbi:hypothetical protein VIGAN_04360600 [Vigna angularis var. angularis]|uniref:Uncharacterized protein n=1 Tax=Vigna angularis var. angularis TaxID=157739 RepID=A0A0S3RZI9_PHAAN|nr:hypothetical protein VIGAN_04360600 [Vigna angularis var. angularis]